MGLNVEGLAKKAGCSIKTVQNVEDGHAVYLFTLRKICEALKVPFVTLQANPQEEIVEPIIAPYCESDEYKSAASAPTKTHGDKILTRVDVGIGTSFDAFSEATDLQQLVAALQNIIGTKYEFIVVAVKKSSTRIVLEFANSDRNRLIQAFVDDRLISLNIIEIWLPAWMMVGIVGNLLGYSSFPLDEHIPYGSERFLQLREIYRRIDLRQQQVDEDDSQHE